MHATGNFFIKIYVLFHYFINLSKKHYDKSKNELLGMLDLEKMPCIIYYTFIYIMLYI